MIHSLTIANFKSIKEPLTVSFEASGLSDPCEYRSVFQSHKKTMIKAVGLFGHNGVGKSNILASMKLLKALSSGISIGDIPEAKSQESSKVPSEITITFSLSSGSKTPLIRYGVGFLSGKITYEKLEMWPSQKPALIYERHGQEVNFNPFAPSPDRKKGKKFLKTLKEGESLLSHYEESSSSCGQAITFFRKRLLIPLEEEDLLIAEARLKEDKPFQSFALNFLKAFDSDISSIEVKDDSVYTKYAYSKPLYTPILEEGDGIKRILSLCLFLSDCAKDSCLMVIDPLELYLHGEVSALIIKFFLDEHSNKQMSQILFASHESFLLGQGLLRRDGVIFVYKEEGQTIIHRLKEFGVRTHDKVGVGYDSGKYGTSPTIDGRQLWRLKK